MKRFICFCGLIVAGMASFYFLAQPTAAQKASIVSIGFGGDTMLGRLVNEVLAVQPPAYPWGDMLPLLQATDINILNLETTLTRHTKAVPKVFNFRSDPHHVETLRAGNIHIVSVANNHIEDFGERGLRDTLAALDRAEIRHVGAGLNASDAQAPVIIKRNGITLGIIGATDNEPGWEAGSDRPGTFYFDVTDPGSLVVAIRALRPRVDVVIVSLHWGPNKRQRPTPEFQKAAHALIDAGADIIHGHSAHIFQGIEVYKDKLIMYDTGDFVDDYAVDPVLRNDQTFFFKVQLCKNDAHITIESLELIPAIINNMQINRATGELAAEITARMQLLAAEFGTQFTESAYVLRLAFAHDGLLQ